MLYREVIAVCCEIHTKHTKTLCGQNVEFLGAFANLRKATISFVMYLSFRPHGASRLPLDNFSGNLIFENFFFFRKPVGNIQFRLKSHKKNGYFPWGL